MKKTWKAVAIAAVSLVCVFAVCIAVCKIQYSVYKADNIEKAKNLLLEYEIIDDNFLSAENITKELFTVGFTRVLGMDDNAAEQFENTEYSTPFSAKVYENWTEMKFFSFGYFLGIINNPKIDLYEDDDGIYPQMNIKTAKAIKCMYGISPQKHKFGEALNICRARLIFLGNDSLKRDDFIIMLYNKMNEKRYMFFDRKKIFDTAYNIYRYENQNKTSDWSVHYDEIRSCTYREMLEERREYERIYEGKI